MSERLRKGIVLGILVVTLIWGYFNFFGKRKEVAAPGPQPQQNISYKDIEAPAVAGGLSKELVNEYRHLSWGQDPFYHDYHIVKTQSAAEDVHLRLLGIVFHELNSQALINGKILHVGDTLQDYQIMAIARDHVILQQGRKTVTLWVTDKNS